MLIKLSGGTVYDPAHGIDGKVMDSNAAAGEMLGLADAELDSSN